MGHIGRTTTCSITTWISAWLGISPLPTFAATGDPGWPAYDPERRATQVFDSVTTVAAYPEERSRLLWQDFPFSTLPLLQPAR